MFSCRLFEVAYSKKKGQCVILENVFDFTKFYSFFQTHLASSNELITQLRYDLTIKTDLLHVYTNDAIEDSSPLENKNVNVGILERKIRDLEEENKKLHSEAAELAKEAYECEVKEEKLVTDAVKHLTEANVQINYLSEEFNVKSHESQKQKEEITHLLAQVCHFFH